MTTYVLLGLLSFNIGMIVAQIFKLHKLELQMEKLKNALEKGAAPFVSTTAPQEGALSNGGSATVTESVIPKSDAPGFKIGGVIGQPIPPASEEPSHARFEKGEVYYLLQNRPFAVSAYLVTATHDNGLHSRVGLVNQFELKARENQPAEDPQAKDLLKMLFGGSDLSSFGYKGAARFDNRECLTEDTLRTAVRETLEKQYTSFMEEYLDVRAGFEPHAEWADEISDCDLDYPTEGRLLLRFMDIRDLRMYRVGKGKPTDFNDYEMFPLTLLWTTNDDLKRSIGKTEETVFKRNGWFDYNTQELDTFPEKRLAIYEAQLDALIETCTARAAAYIWPQPAPPAQA